MQREKSKRKGGKKSKTQARNDTAKRQLQKKTSTIDFMIDPCFYLSNQIILKEITTNKATRKALGKEKTELARGPISESAVPQGERSITNQFCF